MRIDTLILISVDWNAGARNSVLLSISVGDAFFAKVSSKRIRLISKNGFKVNVSYLA